MFHSKCSTSTHIGSASFSGFRRVHGFNAFGVHPKVKYFAACLVCLKMCEEKHGMEAKDFDIDLLNDINKYGKFFYSYKGNSGTALEKHFDQHKVLSEAGMNMKRPSQPSINSFFGSTLKDDVMNYIINRGLSLNEVTNPDFRKIVQRVDKKFQMSRDAANTYVKNKAHELRALIPSIFEGEFIALSTDKWTSAAGTSYIALTATMIRKEIFELETLTLACVKCDGGTTQAIYDKLGNMLKEFGLEYKNVSAVVTDCENTMISLAHKLKVDNNVTWCGCFAHLLDRIASKFSF